jgi:hypothetical protein
MHFEGDTPDTVIVSGDVSATLKESMIRIGLGSRIGDDDFMFPSMSDRTMHHLLVAMDFLADPSRDAVMCACPIAWDIINQQIDMKTRGVAACVVAWHTKEESGDPSWFSIKAACGRSDRGMEEDTFLPFDVLAGRVVRETIKKLEMYPDDRQFRHEDTDHAVQTAKPACVVDTANIYKYLHDSRMRFFPSDRMFQPDIIGGEIHHRGYEMCNDSEGGVDYYDYEEYTTFLFYPRWMLVRPALLS